MLLVMSDAQIDGWVEPGFEGVRDAFVANFAEHGEVGAAVCVYVDGRPVVDLWGGVADRRRERRWAEDTVVPVFSSTKGVTAVAANLAIERGLLDPDAPVASTWPEFAAAGKEAITVRQVLSHQAGLPLVEGTFTLDEALSWDPVVEALAAQAPLWPPGDTARLPHAHLRLARGRAAPPGQRAEPGPVRPRRGRGAARPRHLDRPARGGGAAGRPGRPAPEQPPGGCSHRSARRCCWPGCSATRPTCSTTTTCGTRGRCTRASCRRRTASATPARSPGCTPRCVGDGVGRPAHCSDPRRSTRPRSSRCAAPMR